MSGDSFVGTVPIAIAGKEYTLRYDWSALAKLKAQFGTKYEQAISQASSEYDTEVLAKVLSIGLSPALGPEEVAQASPPLAVVVPAIELAIRYAWLGGEEPGRKASDPTRRQRKTLLSRLIERLSWRG